MASSPALKRRKTGRQDSDSAPQTPCPSEPGVLTEPTIDENIYPDATFKNYEEFEKKFSAWKSKFQVPFRVASSEALRTENGSISQEFRYRYVVFHCSRFGTPRMRGGGKRPNQHYLPCNCQAMLRLNFSYADQCLKITSLETRHTNHTLDKDLYEKMTEKEQKRKTSAGRRSSIFSPKSEGSSESSSVKKRSLVKQESPSEDDTDADTEHTHSQSQSPVRCETPLSDAPPTVAPGFPAQEILAPGVLPLPLPTQRIKQEFGGPPQFSSPFIQQQFHQLQPTMPIFEAFNPLAPAPPPPLPNLPYNYNNYTFNFVPTLPPSSSSSSSLSQATTSSGSQISPISTTTSSTTDENEAPASSGSSAFQPLTRPIPLRPSENRAFNEMISRGGSGATSPISKSEIDGILRSTSQMLHDPNLPSDVLQGRMKQLNNLISQWSHN